PTISTTATTDQRRTSVGTGGRRRVFVAGRAMPAHSAAATRTPRGIRFAAVTTDRGIVARQIGREPRAFGCVAVRCPFGKPAVTEQAPFDDAGAPFPTTYWLTCPHLVAQVSRMEAAGGVERWTRTARDDPALSLSLERADE